MKRKWKIITAAVVMLMLTAVSTVGVSASSDDVSVYVRGERFEREKCVLTDSVTRVPFRAFCGEMTNGGAVVSWDGETKTAIAEWQGMTVTARVGDSYIIANGRYLWCGVPNYISDGRMMTAVRPIAMAFGADVDWNGETRRVSVSEGSEPIVSGEEFYDRDELFWLSRIISAESRGEPLLGKLAVGSVVYNRVDTDEYPDTVYDVIFDMKNGVQFTPAYTGSIYNDPTEESVVAAKICMEGYRCRYDVIYFCTTAIRYTSWAGRNRPYVMTIGDHAFFA